MEGERIRKSPCGLQNKRALRTGADSTGVEKRGKRKKLRRRQVFQAGRKYHHFCDLKFFARFVKPDFLNRTNAVGIANGLAWTSVGGETLPIEVQVMDNGSGKITVTGSLGDVMKESAQLAVTWVRVHAAEYGIDPEKLKKCDLHIHAPEGAVPKDGPSAGVTLTTALVSCLSGIPVRGDVAMTGEITLHGNVLPIGGLREKSMAAYREGMKTVLIPKDNEPDLYEVDDEVKKNLTFLPMQSLTQVLNAVSLLSNGY